MNCWEYKNCREDVFKICPAYPENGSTCYTVADVKCGEGMKEFASLDEQVAYCGKCDFYTRERRGSKYGNTSVTAVVDNDNENTTITG
jgi:hypothetical protein